MRDIIDITFDLETADTAVTAAPLQLAAVAWQRHMPVEIGYAPWLTEGGKPVCYNRHADLTQGMMDGLTISADTAAWWSRQSPAVQRAAAGSPADRLAPRDLWQTFFAWVEAVGRQTGARHTVLWCQGQDFDIAMLRHAARRYGLALPVTQYSFRDARTLALETTLCASHVTADMLFDDPKGAPYEWYPAMPASEAGLTAGAAHDALYDAMRTAWGTWHCLRRISGMRDLQNDGMTE